MSMHCPQLGSSAFFRTLRCDGETTAPQIIFENGIPAPGEDMRSVRFAGANSSFWIYPGSTQMVQKL